MFVTLTNGNRYEVAHDYGRGRVVINMEGIFAFVKPVPGGQLWEEDGEPVREDEKAVFNALVATVETTTTAIAPDGTRTTY